MNTNTIGQPDYCQECKMPVSIVDDSIESDDMEQDYRVLTFSCWHERVVRV